jgi:photosystem II stability/assembly factor-like uncharacterized protein
MRNSTSLVRRVGRAFALAAVFATTASTPFSQQADTSSGPLANLKYRYLGVNGNRAIAVAGAPGNPMISYVGAASGGLWKTTDGGASWAPIFEDQPNQSIGSIAIALSDPNIIYVGTGETFIIRPAHQVGNGVYKSEDAGKTWKHIGLEKTGRIGRMLVHPKNPDIAYACAVGHASGPQQERGVFRTTNGGQSWERVLFTNENVGCSDLSMDPINPRVLLAGLWEVTVKPYKFMSGGPNGGVFISRDGGNTWKEAAGNGRPEASHHEGKIAVGIAPSNPDRMYALVEDSTPRFYSSDDGGANWQMVNNNHLLTERSGYYTRFAISTDDPDRLYFMSVSASLSLDGGRTLEERGRLACGDCHDVWVDPLNANRIMLSHDGGASYTFDKGKTWKWVDLPIAQMYHVATDDQVPYHVMGNMQDGGAYRLNMFGSDIQSIGGCEDGFSYHEPWDQEVIWSGCFDGQLDVWDGKTKTKRTVHPWPVGAFGWEPGKVKYRFHWVVPIAVSKHEKGKVWVGSQYVHETTDEGFSWNVTSPDLTSADPRALGNSGGISTDNLSTWSASTLSAINESPIQKGVLWTGSNDGRVYLTRDGGKSWEDVGKNIKGRPAPGQIKIVEPSRYDAATAYVAINEQFEGYLEPFVYKTSDWGKSWKRIDAGIPRSPSSFSHVVREDPKRKGMLYVGTDNGVWVSRDDGNTWFAFQNNLPHSPVHWLTVQERFDDLVIGTYGRGFWVVDDIAPLRELDRIQGNDIHLFKPRDAYRWAERGFDFPRGEPWMMGRGPQAEVVINYYVKAGGPAEDKPVRVVITDAAGDTAASLSGSGKPGVNRVWWGLDYPRVKTVTIRTPPPGKDWVTVGGNRERRWASWFDGDPTAKAAPGTYTVKMIAGGKEVTSQLTVLPDPKTPGTVEGMQKGLQWVKTAQKDFGETVDMINKLEWTRRQIEELKAMLGSDARAAAILKEAQVVSDSAAAIEGQLIDVKSTGPHEDSFRNPVMIYERMYNVMGRYNSGHGDREPNAQTMQSFEELKQQMLKVKARYEEFRTKTLPAFNAKLQASGVQAVPIT